jgi:DNA-binding CsgD family transcriptional regulator
MLKSVKGLKDFTQLRASQVIILTEIISEMDKSSFGYLQKHNQLLLIGILTENIESSISGYNYIINIYSEANEIQTIMSGIFQSTSSIYNKHIRTIELTPREKEVLKWVALGLSNKEIAENLYISVHTVISHRKNITEKLGIKSISGLTVYAILNKIVDPGTIDLESLI